MKVTVEVRNFTASRAYHGVIRRAIVAAFRVLKAQGTIEVSVALVGVAAMRRLSRMWKKKDRATDVLSFGLWQSEDGPQRGEIVVCAPIAERQARALGVSFRRHLAMLAAHGAIHLCGLDHERSERERLKTERMQAYAVTHAT